MRKSVLDVPKESKLINKQPLLGQAPTAAGEKDAVHVAIVGVRAAHFLNAGDLVGINEHGEASRQENKKIGVVDPFRRKSTPRGELVWLPSHLEKLI